MIFDQYQRYKTVQILSEEIKQLYQIGCLNILEIGSNEQCNLEKVLPNENVQYSDIVLPDNLRDDPRFIKVDGRDMSQFEDSKYDIVVALDVLEHIEAGDRESFLKEVYRVSKYAAIICFPYNDSRICSAEKRINNYYKALFGKDHIWLKEHIDNGLPILTHIETWLEGQKYKYVSFKHGNILIWEEMMKALFVSYQNGNFVSFMDSIDEIYEQKIYSHDIGETNYRVFFVLSKEDEVIKNVNKLLDSIFDKAIEQKEVALLYRNINDLKNLSTASTEVAYDHGDIYGKIYFDRKNGFTEDDVQIVKAVNISMDKYRCECCISDIKNIVALRYDPVENQRCIITKCEIKQDDKPICVEYSSCFHGNIGVLLLDTDPMLIAHVNDHDHDIYINIEYLVEGKIFFEEVLCNFQFMQKEHLESSINAEETTRKLQTTRKQLEETQIQFAETRGQLVENKGQLEVTESNLEKTRIQLEDARKKIEDFNQNISILQQKLDCSEKRRQEEFDYSKTEKEMLFSDFHLITDMKDRQIGLLREQLSINKKESDEKDRKIDIISEELQRQKEDSETKEIQINSITDEFQKHKEVTDAIIRDRDAYKERIEKMEHTLSWRLTKGLRFVGNKLRID